MIEFSHIAPTAHLDTLCEKQQTNLVLAHLLETDNNYTAWYRNHLDKNEEAYYRSAVAMGSFFIHNKAPLVTIIDNSAFEMFKQNRPMMSSSSLLSLAAKVCPKPRGAYTQTYIVMSDYPNQPGRDTIDAATLMAPKIREAGFKTFFVPQSIIGDIEDYIATFAWACSSKHVDYIGVSILGVPNAYGVERDNKLQRYMSRFAMMRELKARGLLAYARKQNKLIHFLGMTDGPNEIELCREFNIDTWDSSSAIWAGLNGLSYDTSPTGLVNGKFEKEVDFNFKTSDNTKIELAKANMDYINKLCRGVH